MLKMQLCFDNSSLLKKLTCTYEIKHIVWSPCRLSSSYNLYYEHNNKFNFSKEIFSLQSISSVFNYSIRQLLSLSCLYLIIYRQWQNTFIGTQGSVVSYSIQKGFISLYRCKQFTAHPKTKTELVTVVRSQRLGRAEWMNYLILAIQTI